MNTRTLVSIGVLFFSAFRSAYAIGGIDTPPPASAPSDISFAQPKETRLENGLRVIVAERPGLPLLAMELLVRTGAEIDPEGLAGAASMTGSLLTEGTEKMSATQIAVAIESLGGSIDSGARWDASSATVVVMSDKAEAALAILSDVILHPAFKQEEIDRLKKQTLDSLRVMMQQPGALARYVTDRVVFGSSEYAHAASGTMESVQAIQRDDLVKIYKTYYTPENATLILAGDVTLEQGKKYAQQFFGDWKAEPSASKEPPRPSAVDWKPENVIVDMPEAGQASVTVAKPGVKRDSPDYYAGLVTNAALGTGFVSRLNNEIRKKRGLSYGARSALDSRRDGGSFFASAQTKNESAAEVAGLLQSELKRLGTNPVEGEELKSRQAVLTGGYARNLETNRGLVAQIASLVTYNRPLDTVNKFIPTINAITAADVSAFAAKHFSTPPSLVIVGKAPDFLEALKKDFPTVRVIPHADLDLNRADLTRKK
jgi:zinc protease